MLAAMNRPTERLGLRLCTLALLVAPHAAQASESSETDRVDTLYRRGDAALERSDWQAAYDAYAEAWTLRKTFDIATNLGQTELHLGKARDAAEHLAMALNNFPPSQREDRRKLVQELLLRAKESIATLKLEVRPNRAEVFVDDDPLGPAEGLPHEVYVDPGKRNISVRLDGYEPANRTVKAEAGRQYQFQFELNEDFPTSGLERTPAMSSDPEARERSMIPVYIGAGLGVVGVSAGLVFTLTANSREKDADILNVPGGQNACAGSDSPECQELKRIFEDVDTNRNLAVASFVVGGVAVAATAAYLLWPQASTRAAGSWRAAPLVSADGAGLLIARRF